jgi:succinate dehydrogenase / fumarate reductase cytochrome b subunit
MSKSAIMKSSLAKKYWMALTGLFLCTFLIGHLLGNLQLVFKTGEEGRRAFNEYAYFMGHNIFIKVLSYATYISILFHAIDGIMLAVQNKKARPQNYAYNNPGANSSLPSRYMAILGTVVLVFISTHMANFWWKAKITEEIPVHLVEKQVEVPTGMDPMTGQQVNTKLTVNFCLTTAGEYKEFSFVNPQTNQLEEIMQVRHKTHLYDKKTGLQIGETYKDLHTVVMKFFSKENSLGLAYLIFYVVSMLVLMFHLWHGFASAFQTLGIRHKRYTPVIEVIGKAFAVIVPLAFAIIPIILYTR